MSETTRAQTRTQAEARQAPPGTRRAGAFDIRNFIGALIGLYGLVLVLTGFWGTSDSDLARADGLNINLWAGVGMVVVAAGFFLWARLRPVVVPEETTGTSTR